MILSLMLAILVFILSVGMLVCIIEANKQLEHDKKIIEEWAKKEHQ
jgi:hypothetical protein